MTARRVLHKHMPESEFRALREYLGRNQTTQELAVELLLLTGMRQEELCRLRGPSFDPEKQRVYVDAAKHSRSRWLPVAVSADRLRALATALGARDFGALLAPDARDPGSQTRAVRRIVARVLSRALGAEVGARYSAHSLRHTFALRCLRAMGNDILKVQLALGHKSVSSTARYLQYLQSEDLAEEILKAVG